MGNLAEVLYRAYCKAKNMAPAPWAQLDEADKAPWEAVAQAARPAEPLVGQQGEVSTR